jgi:tol-pal system protein YbgF
MKKPIAIGTAVMVSVLGAGMWSPAAAQNRREMQMMADIRMLQEQNQQLQVLLAQLSEALNGSIKAVNGRLDEQANTNRKAFADQNLKVDQFGSDLRVVREGVSENNVRISQLSQELEAVRLSIPQYQQGVPAVMPPSTDPNAPLPVAGAPAAAPTAPVAPVPTTPAPSLPPGMSPQRVYDTAWADYTSGQWELCISGFDMYLRTFPRSDLADEAQFYIGECNYADGKNQEAVQAYTQVITNYPRGQSVAPAYYKRGLAFERLGQIDRARESFEAVIKTFPESDAARLAKQNLDRLNRGKPLL